MARVNVMQFMPARNVRYSERTFSRKSPTLNSSAIGTDFVHRNFTNIVQVERNFKQSLMALKQSNILFYLIIKKTKLVEYFTPGYRIVFYFNNILAAFYNRSIILNKLH